jgi:ATP-binding cassette, subfamily C, bacterial
MQRLTIMLGLLRQMRWQETLALLAVMVAARMTEGVGLLLVVPLLESLYGGAASSEFSRSMIDGLADVGIPPTLGGLLGLFVMLVAVRAALLVAERVMALGYQQRLVDVMRQRLFESLLRAEWRWLSTRRSSDHAAVLTGSAGRIAVGLTHFVQFTTQMVSLVAYGGAALLLSWQVTACLALGGLLVHGLMGRLRRRAVGIGQDMGDANRAVQASLQEGLAGARLAKIVSGEQRVSSRFAAVVGQLRDSQLAFVRSAALGQMAMQIGGALLLAALIYSGRLWLDLPVSVLLTVAVVVARLVPVFAAAQQSYHGWLNATPAIQEFGALHCEAQRAAEPHHSRDFEPLPLREAIVFDGVSVGYGGRSVAALNSVSLTLPARSTTLVVGPSGAGKSTFADLLMALIEPDAGRVLVDGIALTGGDRQRWRASVAYVEQDCFLFNDSIRANLLWAAPQASEADIDLALRRAAAEFVFALPDGIDTVVGDSGSRLSGGERQRLALARALIGKPALLILDEATSALDLANQALVQNSLAELARSVTLVVIAHRSEGWGAADQIVRFDAGRANVEIVDRALA